MLQVNSVSDKLVDAIVVIPDCVPLYDAIAAAGYRFCEEVLKAITALLPKFPVAPFRSDEIAPIKT